MDEGQVSPVRVLVADDKAEIRLLLRARLELEEDFEVVGEAGNGKEACRLAEILAPQVIVLDLTMPVMGGDEAIPIIRRLNPNIGIVVYTGNTPTKLGGASSPDTSVLKGGPLAELLAALREVANHRAYEVLRLQLGNVPLPIIANGFDALAGLMARLLEISDEGDEAIPGLSGTNQKEVRALLGIYVHLGFSLRRAARAGMSNIVLVVHAFRAPAAMARRALLALGSDRMLEILKQWDVQPPAGVDEAIRLINSRLLDSLPRSIPARVGAPDGGENGANGD